MRIYVIDLFMYQYSVLHQNVAQTLLIDDINEQEGEGIKKLFTKHLSTSEI